MNAGERASAPSGMGAGLLRAAWRYRWVILAAGVLFGVAGYFAAGLQAVAYEAEARLLLGAPQAQGLFGERPRVDVSRNLSRETARMTSSVVLTRAAARLGGQYTVAELDGAIRAEEYPDIEGIAIVASASRAEEAADIANAVGEAYQEVVSDDIQESVQAALAELNEARSDARSQLAELQRRLDVDSEDGALQAEADVATQQLVVLTTRAQQLAVEAALFGSGIDLFEPATPPSRPVRPRPMRSGLVAGVLGFCAAGALAWRRAERNELAEDGIAIAEILGAPMLGEIPVFDTFSSSPRGDRPVLSALDPIVAESYQFVLSSLRFSLRNLNGRSVVLTSIAPGDGKTVTAMNLAFAAAQDGTAVTVVDGDERVRGLTMRFRLSKAAGLSDFVDGRAPMHACRYEQVDVGSQSMTRIVPAGRAAGQIAGFYRRPEFHRAMQQLAEDTDLLVVDTPPLLAVSDVMEIAESADGIVVVVDRGTPLRRLQEASERLYMVGTPVIGFILNRSKRRRRHRSYERYYQRAGFPQTGKDASAPAHSKPVG